MISRCLAGTLLGFPLAAVLPALLLHLLPGGNANLIPLLILFFPLWIACMAGAYAARSGARAWLALVGANAAAFLALWLLRH
jgi:hypothetical protein